MYLVKQITTNPLQNMTLILPNGNPLQMSMNFVSMQYGWFITRLVYESASFNLNGLRITNNPNLLYPWKNLLQFGLGCFSDQALEPMQQYSFSSGASRLYILDASEVEALTEFYQNGAT